MAATKREELKAREKAEQKRRIVYKPVIDSPYRVVNEWPLVENRVQVELLDELCSILAPLGDHRRSEALEIHRAKRRKIRPTVTSIQKRTAAELPKCLVVGFNACTRYLEDQISSKPTQRMKALFVCKADLKSELVVAHFPALTTISAGKDRDIRLVSLPEGAESKLSLALGLPRVSAIGVLEAAESEALLNKIHAVIPLADMASIDCASYIPTNIKHIITSAPIVDKKSTKATIMP